MSDMERYLFDLNGFLVVRGAGGGHVCKLSQTNSSLHLYVHAFNASLFLTSEC
jgi:hypothetical protein